MSKVSKLFYGLLALSVFLLPQTPTLARYAHSVTIITDVIATGEVVAAVAIQFPQPIDGSSLSLASFRVEATLGDSIGERTITKVYTNNTPALCSKSKPGRYVIAELDIHDPNAGTTYYDSNSFLTIRYDLNYTVVQIKDVMAVTKSRYPASASKLKSTAEVTPVIADFKEKSISGENGTSLNYRFFAPSMPKGRKYPLVIFLHGAGERGYDNHLQIVMSKGALVWTTDENQKQNPCFVAAPQCPGNLFWGAGLIENLILKMIDDIQRRYPIDANRIYLTGLSMGGNGTWNLIQANPELFAAAMPICGFGNTTNIPAIKDLPIWAFHAADDPTVPVSGSFAIGNVTFIGSRDLVAAVQAAGSTVIKYTEYEKGYVAPPLAPSGHMSWIPAYSNQEAIDWMFAQRKTR